MATTYSPEHCEESGRNSVKLKLEVEGAYEYVWNSTKLNVRDVYKYFLLSTIFIHLHVLNMQMNIVVSFKNIRLPPPLDHVHIFIIRWHAFICVHCLYSLPFQTYFNLLFPVCPFTFVCLTLHSLFRHKFKFTPQPLNLNFWNHIFRVLRLKFLLRLSFFIHFPFISVSTNFETS